MTITAVASNCTYQSGTVANYRLTLSTVALDSDGKPTSAGDLYSFNIYSGQPLNLTKPMPSSGTYTLASTHKANTISPNGSGKESYILTGDAVTSASSDAYTAVSLVVTLAENDTFSILADITLKSGEKLILAASGIACSIPPLDIPFAVDYRCEYYGGDPSNVLVILSTAPLDKNGHPTVDGDLYTFDLYSTQPTDKFNPMPAEGVYTLAKTDAVQTIGNKSSYYWPYRDNGQGQIWPGDFERYKAAEVTITHTGDTFSLVAEITLGSGELFKIQASNLTCPIPGADEYTEDVDMTAVTATALHYALTDDYGNPLITGYIVELLGENTRDWFSLRLQGPIAPIKDNVPTGVFTFKDTLDPDVAIPGAFDVTKRAPYGCYYATEDLAVAYMASGTITISKTGSIYTYVIDAVSDKGLKIKGKYVGEVPIEDGYAGPYNSTLIDDYALDLSDVQQAEAVYYGDMYSVGTGTWNIYLDPKTANKDGYDIQVFVPSPTSVTMPTGTFYGSMSGQAGSFYNGYIYYGNFYPTMFYKYGNGTVKNYSGTVARAPISGGSITITQSGSNYVFDINSIDDRGHKITGKWTGPVSISQGK